MAFRLLLLFTLLMDKTGFCAEISEVFVKTGDLVQLDIQTQQLPQVKSLSWSNDKPESIVRYTSIKEMKDIELYPIYKDRVDFNETSFSLTLKNMQKSDSGVYRATHGILDKTIASYRVSVIDEVEDPVLTNSSWSSPDPCNFTCEGRNIFISYNFNGRSCSSQEVTSADNHTLRLNCSNDSIMCNYSNPVSFKTVVKKVPELCSVQQGLETEELQASVFPDWIIVLICLLALILVAGIIFSISKGRKGSTKNEETISAKVDSSSLTEKSREERERSAGILTRDFFESWSVVVFTRSESACNKNSQIEHIAHLIDNDYFV